LSSGGEIVRVGDVAVRTYRELSAELARNPNQALLIAVEQPGKEPVNEPESGAVVRAEKNEEFIFDVRPQPLQDLGLVMTMGEISAVQARSPAARAGITAGDMIERVDGQTMADEAASADGWTPLTLPDYLRHAGIEGREVEFSLRRGSPNSSEMAQSTVRVTPVPPSGMHSDIPPGGAMAADAVGIAYRVDNRVHAVEPGGAAASAGIVAGDRIDEAAIHRPAKDNGTTPKPVIFKLSPTEPNWPALIDALQFAPAGTNVELTFRHGNEEPRKVTVSPQRVDGRFIAPRGFLFEPLMRTRTAETFVEQLRYGFDETVESLTLVFRFLQKLGTQVPITMLGGPGTIAVAAGASASQGLSSLLIFLTMLSANLAVLNFLPIPLLDGGHMVFLAYEGIRGRPAPEKFVLALHTAGFVFIIGLMVFVIGLDIQRWLLT
jgi:regulator of sigma E protease